MEKIFLTVKEYAEHVSASERTISAMCRTGKLPAVKIGVGWRINLQLADEQLARKAEENLKSCQAKKTNKSFDFLAAIQKCKKVV